MSKGFLLNNTIAITHLSVDMDDRSDWRRCCFFLFFIWYILKSNSISDYLIIHALCGIRNQKKKRGRFVTKLLVFFFAIFCCFYFWYSGFSKWKPMYAHLSIARKKKNEETSKIILGRFRGWRNQKGSNWEIATGKQVKFHWSFCLELVKNFSFCLKPLPRRIFFFSSNLFSMFLFFFFYPKSSCTLP